MCVRTNARWVGLFVVALSLSTSGLAVCLGDDAPDAAPKKLGPLSVAESLDRFKLQDGWVIEPVATEPAIVDPVNIAFDELGRLWVVEMRDYPWGPRGRGEPISRIKTLTDRDGDGVYETAVVFADKLLFPTGLLPWKGGVIVTLAGEVVWLRDTNGDGVSDTKEVWFKGFAQENSQLRANHPRLGLDGLIYIANGLRGGKIVGGEVWKQDQGVIELGSLDFRFDPRTGRAETITGAGQFGLAFDSFGERFICSNRNPCMHVVLENEFVRRNPQYAPPALVYDAAPAAEKSRVHSIAKAWTTSTTHAGQFTAACGVIIYRGGPLFPAEITKGALMTLTCEPTGSLVHATALDRAGATFVGRDAGEQAFLASDDTWFRPVDLEEGPDGSLYVVDMYRAVIEHPEWVPKELQNRADERDGDDRGRVWRVRRKETPRAPTAVRLGELPPEKLPEIPANALPWEIDTRFRLVEERGDPAASVAIREVARSHALPNVRARALGTLFGRGELAEADILTALADASPEVRTVATALANRRQLVTPAVAALLQKAVASASGRELFEIALATAGDSSAAAIATWSQAIARAGNDVWITRAVCCAAGQRLPEVLIRTIDDLGSSNTTQATLALTELATAVARFRDRKSLPAITAALARFSAGDITRTPVAGSLLIGLMEGWSANAAEFRAVWNELVAADPEVAKTHRQLQDFASAHVIFGQGGKDTVVMENVASALKLWRLSEFSTLANTFSGVLEAPQVAAEGSFTQFPVLVAETVATFTDPEATTLLAKALSSEGQSPALRRALLRSLVQTPARQAALVDALDAKAVAPAELDAAAQKRLAEHPQPEVRERAKGHLASLVPADRQKVLADYQIALTLKADPKRGRLVFEKNCATCHKIDTLGVNVGPDIGDYSRTKTAEQLLSDILQPNRAIDNNYLSYTVQTKAGQTETGILAAETSTSITLRQADGKTLSIVRGDIEAIATTGLSLMPDGVEKNITPEQMADVISFVRNWRYLDGQVPADVRAK
jgi:putative membrane-bound dehydrogenase-like protein